jgi:hypothetical protein
MKWMHQRNIQNKGLREKKWSMYMNDGLYRSVCIRSPFYPSPPLSVTPINKDRFESIIGFHEHPNSSQEM